MGLAAQAFSRVKKDNPIYLVGLGHGATHWVIATFYFLLPFMAQDLGLSYVEAGVFASVFSLASFGANVFSGPLVDITGRRVLWQVVSLLVGAVALYAMGAVSLYPLLVLAMIFIGMSNNLWHPAAISYLSLRYPDRRGYVLSIHALGANLGDAVAPVIMAPVLAALSWRATMEASIVVPLVVAVLLFFFVERVGKASGGIIGKPETQVGSHKQSSISETKQGQTKQEEYLASVNSAPQNDEHALKEHVPTSSPDKNRDKNRPAIDHSKLDRDHSQSERMKGRDYLAGVGALLKNRAVMVLCCMSGFRNMAQTGLLVFLPLYLANDLKLSPFELALTLFAFQAAGLIAAPVAGIWSDRIGRRPLVVGGLGITTVMLILLTLIDNTTVFVAGIAMLGFGLFAIRPVVHSWLMDMTPPHMGGTATSVLFGVQSAMTTFAPIIGGALADRYGLISAFYFLGVTLLIANFLVL
ncbi:MFS transporter, partial [uncultured Kiloniella sp.]|uniref:MFS transporter n=1 Tax=uncultured Kiloniella sp. TaxID=1133091 RepID=UPI00260D73C7